METFTTIESQNFARRINCMSDLEFADMYRKALRQNFQSYIDEKFEQCRRSFLIWICEMDSKSLNSLMNYVLN